jgi:lysophospholipase L1-like esterase
MGDSLTNGWCSADYLRGLRQRFGAGVDVVNAGINGDMAYNLLQRADDTVALDGVAGIVVLIGTNDMLGSLRYVRPPLGNLRVDNTITRLRAQATTPPPYKSCVC